MTTCIDCRSTGWIGDRCEGGWIVERAKGYCHCPAGHALKDADKAQREALDDDTTHEPTTFADTEAEHYYTLYGSFGEPNWAA